jgi:hypothetical protein
MATAEMEIDLSVNEDLLHKYRRVRVSIERIGTLEALEYLKCNTKNRPLNKRHELRLRDIMSRHEWYLNGETIIFSSDGVLLNGQHRLHAIINSATTIDVLVVRGIDARAFRSLDGGKIRTTGDVLAMDNERNSNAVAGAIAALVSFVDASGSVYGSTSHARKVTGQMAHRILEAHPGIRDSVHEMKRGRLFSNQFGFMLHYVFGLSDSQAAADFADVIAEGHADVGRPFMVFREHMIHHQNRPDLRRAHCAKAIKAFNAEVCGERPKMLKFITGEEFPTIAGLDYERLAESLG